MKTFDERDEQAIKDIYDVLIKNYTEDNSFDVNSAISVLSFLLILLLDERGKNDWLIELSINDNIYKINIKKE
jgi:hypothetical protein